jgi:hypothetical protein
LRKTLLFHWDLLIFRLGSNSAFGWAANLHTTLQYINYPIRNKSGDSADLAACYPLIPLIPLINSGFERKKYINSLSKYMGIKKRLSPS